MAGESNHHRCGMSKSTRTQKNPHKRLSLKILRPRFCFYHSHCCCLPPCWESLSFFPVAVQVAGPKSTEPTLPWGPRNLETPPGSRSQLLIGCIHIRPHRHPVQSRSSSGQQPWNLPDCLFSVLSHLLHPLLLHIPTVASPAPLATIPRHQTQTYRPSWCEESHLEQT